MTPEEAFNWLRRCGCLSDRSDADHGTAPADLAPTFEFGWVAITKAPQNPRFLHPYVKAIKTLGAWSVGNTARVELSCGQEPDQILFRLKRAQP